ncbi:MAG TPA: hypothetical protein DHW15_11505 [Bacteroidetes bacterium]|jgi:hypothetical protein|nr:MAG: hypothetical protein ABR94_09455 [Sphingobacteriales bacterium BACL12 MAG-120802-bin5]KRP12084.1 MAG: hypothetical protein ABR95_01555 [Sphingobacteriales bacterium BACL12 MAG-120813-bin55]HCK22752.1 hypothetical protein [Bacteroidota bacterium]
MKTTMKLILPLLFIGALASGLNAQVVMKDFVSKDHMGKIEKSVNNNGQPLYWKLEYKNTDGARIYYDFILYKDASMTKEMLRFPSLMRNLEWTYYLDVSMTKDDATKVFAMIFKKDLRWARVKYSPHEGCSWLDPTEWDRINLVDNFQGLLDNTFTQMDKNVKFDCYVK